MFRPSIVMLLLRSGIPRLILRLMLDRRVPLRVKAIIPIAIAYLVMPFDIIPDILPIAGQLDDMLAIVVSLIFFLGLAPKDVVMEHIRGQGYGGNSDNRPGGKIIDGSYRVVDEDEKPNDSKPTS